MSDSVLPAQCSVQSFGVDICVRLYGASLLVQLFKNIFSFCSIFALINIATHCSGSDTESPDFTFNFYCLRISLFQFGCYTTFAPF